MARNVEIKARASNFRKQLGLGLDLVDGHFEKLHQTDTFFNSPKGRLKLREFPDQDAQLIYYLRPDASGPKLSEYHITTTPNAAALSHTLAETLGILGVVKKDRHVLISGRTRIHFDDVTGLGQFIELEVVLEPTDCAQGASKEANALMQQLNIHQNELIESAYIDLILQGTEPNH